MVSNREFAEFLYKLTKSKGGLWGGVYDRLEHLKRFDNLKEIIKGLSSKGWVIVHNKPKFTAISLNSSYKKEIVEFIEEHLPRLKGTIK